jgi:signal transduction histidine kinase
VGLLTTRQPISYGVFLVSLCCHVLLLCLIPWGVPVPVSQFQRELVFFVLLSAACSAAGLLIDSSTVFVVSHVLHGASVVVVAQILGAARLESALFISIPYFAESAVYLGPRAALGASITVATLVAAGGILRYATTHRPEAMVDLLAYLVVAAVLLFALIAMARYREKLVSREERIGALDSAVSSLSSANRAFQLYADSIQTRSAEEERKRITRELHDTVGYALTNITMTVNAVRVLLGEMRPDVATLLDSMRRQAEGTLEETRRILYRLRAVHAAGLVGVAAIDHLVRTFHSATGVTVELRSGNYPETCGSEIDEVVYRLIQEGLINAFRHGRATRVTVNLWQRERELSVRIWDNGVGSTSIGEGIGLTGMRERFASLGGHINPRATADGFEIVGVIPIVKSVVDA